MRMWVHVRDAEVDQVGNRDQPVPLPQQTLTVIRVSRWPS
jgi:hypothetical protein